MDTCNMFMTQLLSPRLTVLRQKPMPQ